MVGPLPLLDLLDLRSYAVATVARAQVLATAALGGAVAFMMSVGACSIAFDLEREQCFTTDDCSAAGFDNSECVDSVCQPLSEGAGGAGGGEGAGGDGGEPPLPANFTCLDGFMAPDPGATTHHSYRFELATGAPGTVPDTLVIHLCNKLDFDCSDPVDESITGGSLVADGTGAIEFDVATSFQGFLKIEATINDPPEPLMPTLVFFKPLIINPMNQNVIRMIDPESFYALSELAGVPIDPTRGTSIILSIDCNDERTPDVTFVSDSDDEDTTPYHFKGALPDPDATRTDDQAAGGYVNMPAGEFTVRATIADTGRFIGETSFTSVAGHLSYVPLGPTEP